MNAAAGTLSHIKVLDVTTFLSGPYATQVLGDLGAEVIKVEPIAGDDTRKLPPNFIAGDSAYYHSINRNKKSIAVNMREAAGQDLVRRLAGKCDVLIENLRPGGLARYGLGWEVLSKEYPRLIYASISGFGQDGPYRDQPAYDMVVQAMSGGMSLTGEPDGRPVRAGLPVGDLAAGLYSVHHLGARGAPPYRQGPVHRRQHARLPGGDAVLPGRLLSRLVQGAGPAGPRARVDPDLPLLHRRRRARLRDLRQHRPHVALARRGGRPARPAR
jgi:crotonobetainyl-CoA:carnitine CoA-transferase CaiB-like acyl-CoA transferase